MSRIQLALNVDDVEAATEFYAKLFGAAPRQDPPGLCELRDRRPAPQARPAGTTTWGGEVGSTGAVNTEQQRLTDAGLATTNERGTTCCYATQDKFWVGGTPGGERWEFYTVLADCPTFAGTPDATACCGTQVTAAVAPAGGSAAAGC